MTKQEKEKMKEQAWKQHVDSIDTAKVLYDEDVDDANKNMLEIIRYSTDRYRERLHEIDNPKLKNILELIKQQNKKFNVYEYFENIKDPMIFKKNRLGLLQEETTEAIYADNMCDFIDALVDVSVIAIGTLDILNVDVLKVFNDTINANLQKEVSYNTKRGQGQHDLVKPKGWMAPCHCEQKENIRGGMKKWNMTKIKFK